MPESRSGRPAAPESAGSAVESPVGPAAALPPRRRGALRRGFLPALVVCGFLLFTLFLGWRLREGFDRQLAEDEIEAAEEPEDVVSRAIEFTVDEQGRPLLTVVAEEATGRSDGRQRFLGVTARFYETWEGGDAEIAADELLIDTGSGSLEFIGNALLVTEGLELGGPHLRFRRAPDNLWSNDPIQFSTEEFVGIALSFRFRIDTREVVLRGVTVVSRSGDGVSALAETAVFDPVTTDTTLFGEVELATDRVELTSRENVLLRRDGGRVHTLEAGFASVLRLLPAEAEPGETPAGSASAAAEPDLDPELDPELGGATAEAAGPNEEEGAPAAPEAASENASDASEEEEEETEAGAVLYGDSLSITLGAGRRPERVVVDGSPLLVTPAGAELRGDRAELDFRNAEEAERAGTPGDVVRFTGEVSTEVLTAGEFRYRIEVESERAEITLDGAGTATGAVFTGEVEATVSGTTASGDTAVWDGAATLRLTGSPRVRDGSALDLEGRAVEVAVGPKTAVTVRGEVGARIAADRVRWLPGDFESAALFCETATLESGSGQASFDGGVRLLFGRSRFEAAHLELDTGSRVLLASGGVESAMEVRTGDAAADRGPADGGSVDGAPVDGGSVDGGSGDGGEPFPDGSAGTAAVGEGEGAGETSFTASADRFEFRAAEGRMRWTGDPSLEVGEGGDGEPGGGATRVVAGTITAELTAGGALAGLVGERPARFEQAGRSAEGRRIRYEPQHRRLTAWGAPAKIVSDGRTSEGGRLVVEMDGEYSEVEASRQRRATARTRLDRRRPGAR